MKCDGCRRERTDEQLSIHDSSGIRFCRDREDCHRFRKEGRYHEVAQEVIDLIISGTLLHATCAEDAAHGCVVVWSSGAQEQIGAHLAKRLRS
jgi:hypothetical protein